MFKNSYVCHADILSPLFYYWLTELDWLETIIFSKGIQQLLSLTPSVIKMLS
jgi:hypothetical protein